MDIRLAAYNPATATNTASRSSGNPLAASYAQAASNNAAITPVAAARPIQDAVQSSIANNGEGYTDHIRGSLINILA